MTGGRWWCRPAVRPLGLVAAIGASGGAYRATRRVQAEATAPADVTLDARLLLVAVDGSEPALAAMRAELEQIGMPYVVATTASAPLAASALSDTPGHGLYDGIVRVACGGGTGPDAASVAALDAYATAFGVRSACLFARGDATLGLGAGASVDSRTSSVSLRYTATPEPRAVRTAAAPARSQRTDSPRAAGLSG